MRLERCAEAYIVLTILAQKELPYETSYAISRVMRELKGEFDFFAAQEMELMQAFGAKDDTGKVVFGNGEFAIERGREEEYLAEREKLCGIEIKYALDELVAPPPEKISAKMLDTLEGFIRFEE